MAQLWRSTWGWTLSARSDGHRCGGGDGVLADEPFDGVGAEASSGAGREQWLVAEAGAFARSRRRRTALGGCGERDRSVLAAFAVAADVGAGAEGDVAAVEPGELGDAQPGLDGERAAAPGRVDLPIVCGSGAARRASISVGGEERHGRLVEPFRWDGQHSLDQRGVFGVAQRRRR